MRGLTALELQLGNAFGKTEDVLEEDSVVPVAWQVCIGLELFFHQDEKLLILFGGRHALENS